MRRPGNHERPRPRFNLRRMTLDDLDAVMVIEDVAFKTPWSRELFRRELGHEWSTILIAEELAADGGGRVRGFVIYWVVHDEVHVLNIATDPGCRRRGVARELLCDVMSRGVKGGARLATLEVRRTNDAALGLYRTLGFRQVGVRQKYYADEDEDAIVMVLDL